MKTLNRAKFKKLESLFPLPTLPTNQAMDENTIIALNEMISDALAIVSHIRESIERLNES